jgi:hypothetical protein
MLIDGLTADDATNQLRFQVEDGQSLLEYNSSDRRVWLGWVMQGKSLWSVWFKGPKEMCQIFSLLWISFPTMMVSAIEVCFIDLSHLFPTLFSEYIMR